MLSGPQHTPAVAPASRGTLLATLWVLCVAVLWCPVLAGEGLGLGEPVWREDTSLALTEPLPLPFCQDNPGKKCLQPSPRPMSWDAAHDHCRHLEGFLVSRDEYNQLKEDWSVWDSSNLTWTALAPYNGHYQWLSSCPAPSEFVTWRELPEPWARDCAALDVSRKEYRLHACEDQLPFFCLLEKTGRSGLDYEGYSFEAELGMEEDLSDIELRVEGSSPPTDAHGWYSLTEGDFLGLTLYCRAYNRFNGELLPLQPKVFWRKDLVYTSHCVADMNPATIHDVTKSEADAVLPGVTEVAPLFMNQGTYWCEAWLPGSTKRLTSNKVLMTLNDRLVLLFNAHRREAPPGDSVDEAKQILRNAFRGQFNNISSFMLDVISVEKEAELGSSDLLAKYSFHLHMNISQLELPIRDFQYRLSSYKGIYVQRGYLSSSSVRLPTFCFPEVKSFGTGRELLWPFTAAGDVHPVNYKCKVKYNQLSPGRCEWNYTHGAQITLDSTSCEWEDLCPRGYNSIHDDFCVSASGPDSWSRGFSAAYSTSQEMSVLDSSLFFWARRNRLPVYDIIKELVVQGTAQTKIWLPVRRQRRLSPLTFVGPHQPQHDYWFHHPSSANNITWAEGHPRSHEECLALNLETRQMQTSDCDTPLPFVALTNGTFLKKPLRSWDSLVTSSRGCPPGWSATIFKSDSNICFKLFVSKRSLTWLEASNFCKEMYAQLPSPNVGFLDWVYRQHLYNHNVDDTWMGVRKIHGRLLYTGSVDNINWLADTDYTQLYGTLTQFGWTLEGEEVTKSKIICQQSENPVDTLRLQIHDAKSEASQTMCIGLENEQLLLHEDDSSLRCHVNGEYTKHEQTKEPGCQYELKVRSQGYYECQAWTQPPLTLTHSNVILHRDQGTFTFVVTLWEDVRYRPEYHDSTFMVTYKGRRTSESCIDVFMANLQSSNLTDHYRFSSRNLFYLPEADFTLLHNFHLECELKRRDSTLTETQHLEVLTDMLTVGEHFSNCTLRGIRGTVGCSGQVTPNYGSGPNRNLTWPATRGSGFVLPKELCITPEGEPVTRECLGDFVEGYYPGAAGNCTGEPSEVTKRLWEITSDPPSYFTSPTSLANLTANSSSLLPVDVHLIAKTFEAFAAEEKDVFFDFDDIVKTLNNFMGANGSIFEPVQRKLNSTGTLLEAFEALMLKVELPKKEGDQKLDSSWELISVKRLDLKVNSTIVGYMSRQQDSLPGRVKTLVRGVTPADLVEAEAAIIFPSNLTYTIAAKSSKEVRDKVLEEEKVSLTFAIYRNEKLFQDNVSMPNYTVNSHIIQASFRDQVVRDMQYPVKIYFKPFVDGNDTKCVFWDFLKNKGLGGWSDEGCRKGQSRGHQHLCLCNHLTSFALLINYNSSGFSGAHALALDIITKIGCSLSILGLLLVFITFFLFKKWRRSLSNKILVNLSFSVFCSLVIFMAGINQTWSLTLCRGVAVGLHYFILASFGWMLVEAVHQYLKFVKVVGTYIPRFLWKASVCAWGIPVLPILGVLVYDSSLYDSDKDYNDNTKICWMSPIGFKYAFLPPLVATMTVNLIIFSLIIHGAVCGRARVTSTMSERTLFMNQLRMAICVFFLLGFTWIFGLLAVSQIRILFSYLFCIFNTMQGFLLFVFHVFRERSARKCWKDFLSVLTHDPVSSTQGNSLNLPNSRDHRDSVTFDKYGGILVMPQGSVRPHLRRTTRTSLLSARTASTLVHSRASFTP